MYQTIVKFGKPIKALYATPTPKLVLEGTPAKHGVMIEVDEMIVSTILNHSTPRGFPETAAFKSRNGEFHGPLEISSIDGYTGRWMPQLYLGEAYTMGDEPFVESTREAKTTTQESDLLQAHLLELFRIREAYRKHNPKFQVKQAERAA